MKDEYQVLEVAPTVIASIRGSAPRAELGRRLVERLDEIYAFLKGDAGPIELDGHNVCVYHAFSPSTVDLEAGVQVSESFASTSTVRCSQTPGGRAARLTYVGEYAALPRAHASLDLWLEAQGLPTGGIAWEVYDHIRDPAGSPRTDIYRLIPDVAS